MNNQSRGQKTIPFCSINSYKKLMHKLTKIINDILKSIESKRPWSKQRAPQKTFCNF